MEQISLEDFPTVTAEEVIDEAQAYSDQEVQDSEFAEEDSAEEE